MSLFSKIVGYSSFITLRHMHRTPACHSYDINDKTTFTILNKNFDYGLMIDNITEYGFTLNNGMKTIGPTIVFPKTLLSWNIDSSSDMNKESFSLLLNLEPKLDIVIIGLDKDYPYNSVFLQDIKFLFRKHNILTEILPVHQACSTFNFLNAENRYAAAALIPPKIKDPEDILLSNYNNKALKGFENKADPFLSSKL